MSFSLWGRPTMLATRGRLRRMWLPTPRATLRRYTKSFLFLAFNTSLMVVVCFTSVYSLVIDDVHYHCVCNELFIGCWWCQLSSSYCWASHCMCILIIFFGLREVDIWEFLLFLCFSFCVIGLRNFPHLLMTQLLVWCLVLNHMFLFLKCWPFKSIILIARQSDYLLCPACINFTPTQPRFLEGTIYMWFSFLASVLRFCLISVDVTFCFPFIL